MKRLIAILAAQALAVGCMFSAPLAAAADKGFNSKPSVEFQTPPGANKSKNGTKLNSRKNSRDSENSSGEGRAKVSRPVGEQI